MITDNGKTKNQRREELQAHLASTDVQKEGVMPQSWREAIKKEIGELAGQPIVIKGKSGKEYVIDRLPQASELTTARYKQGKNKKTGKPYELFTVLDYYIPKDTFQLGNVTIKSKVSVSLKVGGESAGLNQTDEAL